MSPLALAAAGLFGLWLLASLCYAVRVPVAFDTLRRWNACRFLSTWTMFAARMTDETGVFVLECCDRRPGELPTTWTTVARGHHWHPLVLLCRAQSVEAAAIQQLGRSVQTAALGLRHMSNVQDLRRFESILVRYAAHGHPLRPDHTREFRLVKRQGSPRTRPDRLIWWFAAGSGRHA